MPSPFPGMDPYLEQYWRDVHARLIIYACDHIQMQLPTSLWARVEERVFVESPGGDRRVISPDVRVLEHLPEPGQARGAVTSLSGVALAEPEVYEFPEEPVEETYIEIIERGTGQRVVTVLEILSPTNKRPGPGQELYLKKRQEFLRADVSIIEIDLVREGERITLVPPRVLAAEKRTPYQVCIRKGWERRTVDFYGITLRQRLPAYQIPLRKDDAPVVLDLQSLVEQAYLNGGYDKIDYKQDPVPPLEPADAAWANELLRSKGLR